MSVKYVAGFMFNGDRDKVVLITKKRPKWQAGKLNGVGGHIEEGESPVEAMVREFEEETGVKTEVTDWKEFAFMADSGYELTFFKAFSDQASDVASMTDEEVGLFSMEEVPELYMIDNLFWLIPMALDEWVDRAVVTTKLPGE